MTGGIRQGYLVTIFSYLVSIRLILNESVWPLASKIMRGGWAELGGEGWDYPVCEPSISCLSWVSFYYSQNTCSLATGAEFSLRSGWTTFFLLLKTQWIRLCAGWECVFEENSQNTSICRSQINDFVRLGLFSSSSPWNSNILFWFVGITKSGAIISLRSLGMNFDYQSRILLSSIFSAE